MTTLERLRLSVIVAAKRWARAQTQSMDDRHLCEQWLMEELIKLSGAEQRKIRAAKRGGVK